MKTIEDAFEYNKRSEAVRGQVRLCDLLKNHNVTLSETEPFLPQCETDYLISQLEAEGEEAEAIARAVCDYVVDHPDDSVVADELKRALDSSFALLQFNEFEFHFGNWRQFLCEKYWGQIKTINTELQRALRFLKQGFGELGGTGEMPQAQEETTPQKQGNKPQQVPSWATTDEAKGAFAKAVERGYMSPSAYGYEWNEKKVLLAYFVARLAKADKFTFGYPNASACKFFNVKGLKSFYYNYQTSKGKKPIKSSIIDDLFL